MSLRPSYANVVSTLALVVAVSGGAYAATQLPKDSVGSKQIKNNAVKSTDIRNRGIKAVDLRADVLADVVRDPDLAAEVAGLATSDQVNAAIDQALADGVVLGARATASLALNTADGLQEVVSLPGIVTVSAACLTSGPNRVLNVRVTNAAAAGTWELAYRQDSQGSDPSSMDTDELAPGAFLDVGFPADDGAPSARYLEVTVYSGPPLTIEVAGVTSTFTGDVGNCVARASVLLDQD